MYYYVIHVRRRIVTKISANLFRWHILFSAHRIRCMQPNTRKRSSRRVVTAVHVTSRCVHMMTPVAELLFYRALDGDTAQGHVHRPINLILWFKRSVDINCTWLDDGRYGTVVNENSSLRIVDTCFSDSIWCTHEYVLTNTDFGSGRTHSIKSRPTSRNRPLPPTFSPRFLVLDLVAF